MKKTSSFFLLVFLIQSWPMKLQAQKTIFILAGQSNMAGRGGVVNDTTNGVTTWDGVVPPQCHPNPSIMKLNAHFKWVEAHEPLHQDIDTTKTNGIGPGMVFANYVLEKNLGLGVVGLVPCAIGGTNISEWEKGKVLYNHMMKRVKVSLRDGGSVAALLWYQGESDTVALASGSGSYIEIVRQAQLGIDLLNLKTVDAKGLLLQPDGLHLSTQAQVDLGKMMADAFFQFVPSSSPNTHHNVSPLRNEASNLIGLSNCVSHIYMATLFIVTFVTMMHLTLL